MSAVNGFSHESMSHVTLTVTSRGIKARTVSLPPIRYVPYKYNIYNASSESQYYVASDSGHCAPSAAKFELLGRGVEDSGGQYECVLRSRACAVSIPEERFRLDKGIAMESGGTH
jgi:hypothetical protein